MFKLLKKMSGLIFIGALVLIIAGGYVYKVTRNLPSIEKMVREGVNPSKYTQVFAADGTPIMSHGKFHHANTSIKEVSTHFIDALLATEDRRFYQHPGIDPLAVGRAVFQNIAHRSVREGGSTLTQQLARNVFLSNERSIDRKIREAALSFELEKKLNKNEILELYINNIYFGEGAYGIAAASEIYFNKKPSRLTVEEAAMLAGMPQAPSAYSPYDNKDGALERRNEVLANLQEVGKLTKEELKAAQATSLHVNPNGRALARADRAPFFNRYVIDQVQQYFDLDEQSFWQSGLKVYTTLDLRAQVLAERAVAEQSTGWGRTGVKQQASLLSLNPASGAIIAYVGGKEYGKSQFDRVSKAIRSPGSLFKVFTYTTAIDQGYDPKRVYLDEPIEIEGWKPENYDKGHHGYMTVARALATSNNVIAVKVLHEIGPNSVVDMARRMGIQSTLNPFLALTLGGSGVNLLEITSAFGVLANQGVRAEPYGIEKVVDAEEKVIYQHVPVKNDVLARGTVDTMVRMMMGVVQKGTGKAADIGRPMAGKTGTSDDYRDAWFIGFTPNIVTGVWVGNDDNTPMKGMTGGALPARIWRTYMQAHVAGTLVGNFDLSYSKPLAEADFITYDLNNLSEEDVFNPNATLENQQPELEQAQEAHPTEPRPPVGGPLIPPELEQRPPETPPPSPRPINRYNDYGYQNPQLPVAPLAPAPRQSPVTPPAPVQIPREQQPPGVIQIRPENAR